MMDKSEHIYSVLGSGPGKLVVIPGLSMRKVAETADALRAVFRCLTEEYTVYVIDRPDCVGEGISNADLAEMTAGTIKYLGIEQCDLIGVSQGGMMAQHLMLAHPGLVRRAVLGATLGRTNPVFESTVGRWEALAAEEEWEELNRDMFEKLYTDEYREKFGKAFRYLERTQKPDDREMFLRKIRACRTAGAFDRLGEIKTPVLVIGSDRDDVVSSDASREMAEKMGSEIYMYSSFRHAVFDEAPDFYPRTLEFFLGKTGETTPKVRP